MQYVVFFFFKQKTAYEMRISDWSSDVCSSDLFAQKRIIVHRLVHVRQHRLSWFNPANPFKRLGEMRMCRMRPSAQCIDNPKIKALQQYNSFMRQLLEIRDRKSVV